VRVCLPLQRKNPGLPNAQYVNYLVDPESSQLYLQMPSGSRRLPPRPEGDGYGSGMYGYQQDSNLQMQQQLGMAHGGAQAQGGASAAMSLEGQSGFSPSVFMAGTPPNWSDPRPGSVTEQVFPSAVAGMSHGGAAAAAPPASAAAASVAGLGGMEGMAPPVGQRTSVDSVGGGDAQSAGGDDGPFDMEL
jgi:hypothetical protein